MLRESWRPFCKLCDPCERAALVPAGSVESGAGGREGERTQELGGVDYMYLTHIDDVADHAKFAERFGAHRIIHRLEANAQRSPQIDECETLLEGRGPWHPIPSLPDATIYFQVLHRVLSPVSSLNAAEDQAAAERAQQPAACKCAL
jgi:hypothetical protein